MVRSLNYAGYDRRIAALLLVLFPVSLFLVGVSVLHSTGYTGIQIGHYGRVIGVDQSGPGVESGLTVGDTILAVNGVRWPEIWNRIKPGDAVLVELRRGQQSLTTTIQASITPLEQLWALWLPLLAAGAFWAAGARLLVRGDQSDETQRFITFAYLSALLLLIKPLCSRFDIYNPLLMTLFIGAAISYFRFYSLFSYGIQQTRLRSFAEWHSGIGVLLILGSIGLGGRDLLQQTAMPGAHIKPFVIGYDLLTSALVGVLMLHVYRHANPQQRRRVRILASVSAPILLVRMAVAGMMLVTPAHHSLQAQWPPLEIGQALAPIAYLFVLRCDQSFSANMPRIPPYPGGIGTPLLVMLIALQWAVIFGALFVLTQWVSQPNSMLLPVYGALALAALLTTLLIPRCPNVARIVNRFSHLNKTTIWQRGQHLVRDLAACRDEAVLIQLLTRQLPALFNAHGAALFLWDRYGGWSCRAVNGHKPPPDLAAIEALAGPLNKQIVSPAGDLYRHAPSVGVAPVVAPAEGVFVCFAAHAQPQGVLWLGPKASSAPYDDQDLMLLRFMAMVGALALENAELTLAADQVRRHLAYELHDHVLQDVYGNLYELQAQRLNGAVDDQHLDRLEHALGKVTTDLRRLCSELCPPMLDQFGLAPALRLLLDEYAAGAAPQMKIEGQIADLPDHIPIEVENALFAITKSALMNIMRHSQATRATLTLDAQNEGLFLEVWDNGVGCDIPANWLSLLQKKQYGLVGMYERTRMIGATFAIESAPNRGTRIEICWPMQHQIPSD